MCDPCWPPIYCPMPCEPRCAQGPCNPPCCPMPACSYGPCDSCCRPKVSQLQIILSFSKNKLQFHRFKDQKMLNSCFINPCACIKRNGLQDNCQRRECRGRPVCMTKPNAICCPSKYSSYYANMTMGKASGPALSTG